MFSEAGLTEPQRQKLWTEGVNTACDLENMVTSDLKSTDSHTAFYKQPFAHHRLLKTFGEMAVAKTIDPGGKLDNRGRVCIFVGYAKNSAPGTYRLLHLSTKRIIVSCDLTWLGLLYGPYKRSIDPTFGQQASDTSPAYSNPFLQSDEHSDEEEPTATTVSNPPTNAPNHTPQAQPSTPTAPRYHTRSQGAPPAHTPSDTPDNPTLVHELRRLQWPSPPSPDSSTGRESDTPVDPEPPDRQTGREQINLSVFDDLFDEFVFLSKEAPDNNSPVEPTTFRQAWDHDNPEHRDKWRAAIHKEFTDMTRRNVWRVIDRNSMPNGRRCVKHKWVFKIKRDGRFRARLVACGYSQIPGVDFTDNYSPVIHDVTYRLLLIR